MSGNDEMINERLLAVYLGDFSFYLPSVRIHWISMCESYNILVLSSILLHQLHSLKSKSNVESSYLWLRLFEMLSGKVIPAKIGLTKEEDLMQIIKRFVELNEI